MRFDDRLDTVLMGDVESVRGRAAAWRQCADLLCQDGHVLAPDITARLLRIVALLGHHVPSEVQDTYAESTAPFCRFPPLMTLLARRSTRAAGAFAAHARLDDASWLLLIPDLGPAGRAQLRRRSDLSAQVRAANDLFSTGDFVLPSPASDAAAGGFELHAIDIRDLVRRIEEYRARQADLPAQTPMPATEGMAETGILRFHADISGRIIDIHGAPRGRFVGLDLSQPARAAEEGCDAATARRFSKRSTISFGRVLLTGGGDFAGTWLCHAEPLFAPVDGSFMGYSGTLRRPAPHELPPAAQRTPAQTGLSADMVRTLLHELRSPLNAISGYAQMINGQYAGPVSQHYRDASQIILDEATILSATISELDLLTRDVASDTAQGEPVDLAAALSEAADALRQLSTAGASEISIASAIDATQLVVGAPPGVAGRLLSLFLHPLAYRRVSDPPAIIHISRHAELHRAVVQYQMPAPAISGVPAAADMFRPGLGFAHDIAKALAEEFGGAVSLLDDTYILNLPLLSPSVRVGGAEA